MIDRIMKAGSLEKVLAALYPKKDKRKKKKNGSIPTN